MSCECASRQLSPLGEERKEGGREGGSERRWRDGGTEGPETAPPPVWDSLPSVSATLAMTPLARAIQQYRSTWYSEEEGWEERG